MNDRQAPEIKGLCPTFVSMFNYPAFAEQADALLAAVYEIRRQDEAGQVRSQSSYNVGYTSFFTRDNAKTHPAFEDLVNFRASRDDTTKCVKCPRCSRAGIVTLRLSDGRW